MQVSSATVELIAQITGPLVSAGALVESERKNAVAILRGHTPGKTLQKTTDQWVTVAKAAKQLGVCSATVRRMRIGGKIQGRYLNDSKRSLRISQASIDALSNQ
ncbi:helix-turn-helix domain-containing protein [Cerasicoccus frondis]|uniref:helix-turn-helix domain-containing protein n=1 Tax=Cerasicoccus frondis TaxID=490090 RepID=UPI0028528769|nr:helix-turn-helix domain-containing protein [Cerasicoccus frondis]